MDQSLHEDQIPQMVCIMPVLALMLLICRETTRDMNMSIIPQIIMFISPQRISLPIHFSTLTPSPYREKKCISFNASILIWCSQDDELFANRSHVGGEEIELITSAGQVSWWKSSSEEFAGDLRNMLDRMQAKIDEMKHFTSPQINVYDEILIWWNWYHILHV